MLQAIELFTGCGGLALGLCEAGVEPIDMVEVNSPALETIRHNQRRSVAFIRDWPIRGDDVRSVSWEPLRGQVDIVAGGPPCQPFSIAGSHRGDKDSRNMWPEAIRAVRETLPRAFLFENVRGLLRPAFSDYLHHIRSELTEPVPGVQYEVGCVRANAADYGAAQQRHRVILYGFRTDLGTTITPPAGTHSLDKLLWDQWVTGEYWRDHAIAAPAMEVAATLHLRRIARLRARSLPPSGQRWRTVRDALRGLGTADEECNHQIRAGARSYPGHTGSVLDYPAKALKAGGHGVPGGENMLRADDGSVRYFTIREAARLQGLPDEMEFPGTWCASMRQLGNAVPVELARSFAVWAASLCRAQAPPRMAA